MTGPPTRRPLWRCPKCRREFARRNQGHNCAVRTVREHLTGKPRAVVALYRRFIRQVRSAGRGAVKVVPLKSAIQLYGRIFFGMVRVLRDRLAVALLLPRPTEHPRITNIQTASARSHLHHFHLRSPKDLDRDVRSWIRAARRIGQELHRGDPESWALAAEPAAAKKGARRAARRKRRPLWRCPKCGKYFVTRNIWHSCARHTEAQHLEGKSDHAVWLYRKLVKMVEGCGQVRIVPAKTYIAFQARVRFAGVWIRKDSLAVSIGLTRRLDDPRVRRIHAYGPRTFVHDVVISDAEDLSTDLEAWLAESYRLGQQEHLLEKQ